MAGLREFLNSPTGKAAGLVIVIVALVVGFVSLKRNLGAPEAAVLSSERVFIDTETGKAFNYTVKIGDTIPVKAPSGKNTGYEAERCYWTKDGKPKQEPTYVLLNSRKGQPEPTFCPDCNRLVVPLNPPASTYGDPPPTQEDYAKNPRRRPQNQEQD